MVASKERSQLEAQAFRADRFCRSYLRRPATAGALTSGIASGIIGGRAFTKDERTISELSLPAPSVIGSMSLEEALSLRKSIRDYSKDPVTVSQLGQIRWAAQGITHAPFRSAPSAGALYPLEIYAVVKEGGVSQLQSGIYHYENADNILTVVRSGDHAQELQSATLEQDVIGRAAVNIVMTAVFERTTTRYGRRGIQYVFQESGHAAQNICLQATALGLGSVVIGAFDDSSVSQVIGVGANERPVYIQPIGVPVA
ncbi:MAG: SagB/ThcOx family dehydrogenase [Nitrososphaerota archaeon]|nr:SagB/ThcOx family dehydrogenase [Nitrososphaerota archaeon]